MNTFEKIKKSWWVIFPFTFVFPGVGFIYIGMKFNNKNWILEGITYELPWFFYFLSSVIYTAGSMTIFYIWLLLLAAFIALIRSIMVAVKLADVYEIGESHTASHISSNSAISNAKEDTNLGACCVCVIFIFIIFAFIAIL